MTNKFTEDQNGQFSFLEENFISKTQEELPLIEYIRKNVNSFREKKRIFKNLSDEDVLYVSKEYINRSLKQEYEEFINSFLKKYEILTIEEIFFIQETYATDFHNLCKLFMDYLDLFIYTSDEVTLLENPNIIQIENIILMDQVSFRDSLYIEIKKVIERRKKLRVNNYLVVNGKKLVEKLDYLFTDAEKNFDESELYAYINELNENISFEDIFEKFDPKFVETNNRETLAMILLWYLEKCVYNPDFQQKLSVRLVQQMELFIAFYFSDKFELSDKQKNAYKQVQKNISKKISIYVNKEFGNLKKNLRDFDSNEELMKLGKYKLFDETEDLENFPEIISKDELKNRLEVFLKQVFLFGTNNKKENLPLFLEELTNERYKALTIALEYLKRFVYVNSEIIDDLFICTLEDYVYHEHNFKITDPKLCATKSKLLGRVNFRNVKLSKKKSLEKQYLENYCKPTQIKIKSYYRRVKECIKKEKHYWVLSL